MKIDWFTFAAQIVNFLILVWLLKKFLYKPVLNAMDKREQRIAARIQKAQEEQQKASEEKERYQELQEEVRAAAEGELQKARQEAEAYRSRLTEEARKEVAENRANWLAAVESERQTFLAETSRVIADQFKKLVHNALRELADESLDARVVDVFLRRLRSLPRQDVEDMRRHAAAAAEPVIVTSAFGLGDQHRLRVAEEVRALLSADIACEFEVDPALVSGISLEAAGKKIRWDLDYYLDDFQKNLALTLERNGKQQQAAQ